MNWDSPEIEFIIDRALAEDLGSGDITTRTLIPDPPQMSAIFLAKEAGILAGFPLVPRIFGRLDPNVEFDQNIEEGQPILYGQQICSLNGNAAALLAGERLALNFLQRLSGIATQTSKYAIQAAPFGISILDTRKTTPLLRALEKYAVKTGGGKNHRNGLYDAVLVKDNHLRLEPDFGTILRKFQAAGFAAEQVEIEVTDLEMLQSAMAAGAIYFLLDNMIPDAIRKCIEIKKSGMYYEASGGVTPENFPDYLIRGIDAISIGGLTHSVKSLDISMEMNL